MVSDRRLKDIWLQVYPRSPFNDLYATLYACMDRAHKASYPDNGTGAPAAWNWILCFWVTTGTLIGFDAAGHIAEETKNASVVAARSILSSAIATGVLSFITIILFLFCTPPIDTWLTLGAPQPFVEIYALALGKGGAVVMTIIAVVSLVLVSSSCISILFDRTAHLYLSLPVFRLLPHLALYLPSLGMESFLALTGLDKWTRRVSPGMPSSSWVYSARSSSARSFPALLRLLLSVRLEQSQRSRRMGLSHYSD